MNSNSFSKNVIIVLLFISLVQCNGKKKKENSTEISEAQKISVPLFNADSAYSNVNKQVAFGPRVPNTPAHVRCGEYLIEQLKNFGAIVSIQEFEARSFDGKLLRLRNIVGSMNPQQTKRILLTSHWDTRPFAEKDTTDKNKPIDGANDGASGVGILLEIARVLNTAKDLNLGVDIIFFDGEDYGHSAGMPGRDHPDTWCLGSQHWVKNKHTPNYSAFYGILLDMVGAKGARFAMEGTSMQYAGEINQKVWQIANAAGYGEYFIYVKSDAITDDHVYINEIAKIPTIDIIDYDIRKNSYFGWYHHTHEDNMSIIDKNTLKAVGQTLLEVLYREQY